MIDTHSHIYLQDFNKDINDVINRARTKGISQIILPNIDVSSLRALRKLTTDYNEICHEATGLHPTSVRTDYKTQLNRIFDNFTSERSVGIGETGIDLYWDNTFFEEQKEAFKFQIDFSIQHKLPVIIHARDSFQEIFEVIRLFNPHDLTGVFHSFTGNSEDIQTISKLGDFYFGINGIVTFKNSDLRNVINEIGLSRIVLETDSPYLAPVPYRGKRNESSYLYYICKHIAEHLNISIEYVDKQTTKNAKMLFNI